MIKRVLVTGLLSIVLVTMLGIRAEAHYLYVSGRLVYHSLSCDLFLKGVSNPDSKPSQVTCTVTGTLVETLCENPADHDVAPGQAATQVTFFGTGEISSDDFNKKKGTASVSVLIPAAEDPTLGLTSEEGCVNPNWHLIEALIRAATVRLDAYTCGSDGECTIEDITASNLASITTLQCTLPASVGFDDVPPPPGTEIPFDCPPELVSFTHVK